MANHSNNQGIDKGEDRGKPAYWTDPYPTQERVDPAIAPLLAAIAAIPDVEVQRVVDQQLAARRAALGW